MDGQISMFEMLDMDETPTIPFEEQKRGMKGWVIEIQGVFTTENGYEKNMVGVTTKQVVLDYDSHTRTNKTLGRVEKWQSAHCTGVGGCKGDGWVGSPKKLYAQRPTWREMQEYVRQNCTTEPYDEIVYTYKDGHAMTHIGVY